MVDEEAGWGQELSQPVYTKSVFIKEEDRTGSVLFQTGTFLHQSHHQSAASSFKVTLDGRYQKGFPFCWRNDESVFFCMTKCRLFIGWCVR